MTIRVIIENDETSEKMIYLKDMDRTGEVRILAPGDNDGIELENNARVLIQEVQPGIQPGMVVEPNKEEAEAQDTPPQE